MSEETSESAETSDSEEHIPSRSSSVESSSGSEIEVAITNEDQMEAEIAKGAKPEVRDPSAVLLQQVHDAERKPIVAPDTCANCSYVAGTGKIKTMAFSCKKCGKLKYCTRTCMTFHWDKQHKRMCSTSK